MIEFVKVTAAYSNAVLTAIMPHVSDFSQRVELRTNPIVLSEVKVFYCDPRKGEIGGQVVLTNGWRFWFQRGHVDRFESYRSFFSLQDPNRISEFIGPVNMSAEEALAFSEQKITRLKGARIGDILARKPRIIGPTKVIGGVVPRYRIQWPKENADSGWTGGLGTEIDLEVDASTKTVQMLSLVVATNFFQLAPIVDVSPAPLPTLPKVARSEGVQLNPVDSARSNALLQAVLPAFSEYARKLQLPLILPVTMSMIREGPYTGVYEFQGELSVQIELTNGCMFNFENGYVETYALLYDTFYSVVNTNSYENLVGPLNMTADEVIRLGYETLSKLGYSEKEIPILGRKPFVNKDTTAPARTNGFSRIQLLWDTPTGENPYPVPVVSMEVDLTKRAVKSISIREPRLYRAFPSIDKH